MASSREVIDELALRFSPQQYTSTAPSIKAKRILDSFWLQAFQKLFTQTCGAWCEERDDLLFYIKYDTKTKKDVVIVLRKDSRILPDMTDSSVLWDETLCMNILQHEFKYELTCCILRAGPSTTSLSSKINTKITLDIYLSHMERRMDKKEKEVTTSYPNLRFYVDNFEEVFSELVLTKPGEKIAVQIVAINAFLSLKKTIFVGGLDFKVLKRVCEHRDKEKPSFLFSLTRRKNHDEFQKNSYHFLPMIGPDGKGHAQMAVWTSKTFIPIATQQGKSESHLTDLELSQTGSDSLVCVPEPLKENTPLNNDTQTPPIDSTSSSPQHVFQSTDNLLDSAEARISSASLSHTGTASDDGVAVDFLKTKHATRKKNKDKAAKVDESSSCVGTIIHTYLTFIELPWYSIMEDILRSEREAPL